MTTHKHTYIIILQTSPQSDVTSTLKQPQKTTHMCLEIMCSFVKLSSEMINSQYVYSMHNRGFRHWKGQGFTVLHWQPELLHAHVAFDLQVLQFFKNFPYFEGFHSHIVKYESIGFDWLNYAFFLWSLKIDKAIQCGYFCFLFQHLKL